MNNSEIILIAAFFVVAIALLILKLEITNLRNWTKRQFDTKKDNNLNPESFKLQMAAYERLLLMTRRISLPYLIEQDYNFEMSCKECASNIIQTIKAEFDYNITQQAYIGSEAWKGVENLKNQNIYIVNQVRNILPENATAKDLLKALANYCTQPNAELSGLVAEVLQSESQNLLKNK